MPCPRARGKAPEFSHSRIRLGKAMLLRFFGKGNRMDWIKRLLRKKANPTWTLPTVRAPEGRPMSPPPGRPKKRGVPPAEYEEAMEIYRQGMRRHFAAIATFNRERRMKIGIVKYRWVSIPGTNCENCDIAKKNSGKVFYTVFTREPENLNGMKRR